MQRASFPESENMPSIRNDSVTLTNTLAEPTLDLAALPTLKLTISGDNRLRIERLDVPRNVWATLYDASQPAARNRLLEFDDLLRHEVALKSCLPTQEGSSKPFVLTDESRTLNQERVQQCPMRIRAGREV